MSQRALLFIALAATACGKKSGPEVAGLEVTPLLALPTADGGRFDPATLRGKKVLVNFWTPG